MVMRLMRCAHCNGAIIAESDRYGERLLCLSCGREVDAGRGASEEPISDIRPVSGRQEVGRGGCLTIQQRLVWKGIAK